jgi:hypothetical protein
MDMDQQPKPILPVTNELVTLLDELIPEKCPELSWTDREIWHYRGMRQVVQLLQSHLKERIENRHVQQP